MVRYPVIVLSVLALAASVMTVQAQSTVAPSTGGNPMLSICSDLLAQGVGTVSGDKNKLCTCLVHETSTKLSIAEMEAYSKASLNSQAPPQDVMNKVMAIATRCLREAQ
jgi:hypothetical protein